MKGFLSLLAVALTIAVIAPSCRSNNPDDKLLNKGAMVYINVTDGKTRAINPDLPANPAHLSPKELVAKAEEMMRTSSYGTEPTLWLGGIIEEGDYLTTQGRKAGEFQYKLLDEAKFVFWGDFVIDIDYNTNEPKLMEELFISTDVRFLDKDGNIIGYIPQRILVDAWMRIQEAFAIKDYETVYQIFRDTYQAYPCTTEEWHELKAQGKN